MKADETPDGGLIHHVGSTLRIGPLIRERCSWCGALVYEIDVSKIAVPTSTLESGQTVESLFWDEDGRPKEHWRGLVWVAETGEHETLGVRALFAVDEQEDVPEKSCMNLDPETTR